MRIFKIDKNFLKKRKRLPMYTENYVLDQRIIEIEINLTSQVVWSK